MAELVRQVDICDGVRATFADDSNRYFGDYNRVSVAVVVIVQLESAGLDESLMSKLPAGTTELSYQTQLEQMGVSTADVEAVFAELVSRFLRNTGDYLKRPVFVERLVMKYAEKRSAALPVGQKSLEIKPHGR